MQEPHRFQTQNRPMNKIELDAVCALVAYVGLTQQKDEKTICSLLAAAFQAEEVASIPAYHYDTIIQFLMDLDVKSTIN